MAARLRAVPDAPLRALAIIRVSKEREAMIAPEIQLAAIEQHCRQRGYHLAGRLEGIDESGSSKQSPWWRKLDEAIRQVETGDIDVIVGWKFSRTARNRLRWAVAVDRVEAAGGLIESATEPLDVSTSAGRLARGMLAEYAAFEAERTGEVWKEVHARRTARGLPASGKPRFGYRQVDGLHRPDPVTGPILADLYRRYIAGEGFPTLVAWLNRNGVTTVGYGHAPGPWYYQTLRRNLDAGFGAGLIRVHGQHLRGAHEPLIDEDTWQAYRAARAARRSLKRIEGSPWPLSGLVWCGCGAKMHLDSRRQALRCERATFVGTPRHPGSYPRLTVIDTAVSGWLTMIATDTDRAAATALTRRSARVRARHDAGTLTREITAVDTALTKLAIERARDITGTPTTVWDAAQAQLTSERVTLVQRLAQADTGPAGDPAELAADLLTRWDLYDVSIRRAMLRELIKQVIVTDGKPRVVPRTGV
jgi:DNA invertase Pin-like site-specific DNA recombinase